MLACSGISSLVRADISSASPLASIDHAHRIALLVSAGLLVSWLVALALTLNSKPVSPRSSGSPKLRIEVVAAACGMFLLAVVSGLFWAGLRAWLNIVVAPANAYEIHATSHDGSWSFSYPNGKVSVNELTVPQSQPVRLTLSATGAAHELHVPKLGLRQIAMRGHYSSAWFESGVPLTAAIECSSLCAEYRGDAARISVVPAAQFEQWLSATGKTEETPTPVDIGGKI